ncbi:MAG: hypothetical protein J1E00_01295 [Oscillospiraceae bacterium]|nr:hypothetical protein [Oscillospiraceae bacterium]
MIENNAQTIRKISAKLPPVNIEFAKAYIQGAIHSHCNTQADKEFSVRILFGGENRDWGDTPLQCIYDYHRYVKGAKDPAESAAKDVGWLFKQVLSEDNRTFEYVGKDTGSIYRLKEPCEGWSTVR